MDSVPFLNIALYTIFYPLKDLRWSNRLHVAVSKVCKYCTLFSIKDRVLEGYLLDCLGTFKKKTVLKEPKKMTP